MKQDESKRIQMIVIFQCWKVAGLVLQDTFDMALKEMQVRVQYKGS